MNSKSENIQKQDLLRTPTIQRNFCHYSSNSKSQNFSENKNVYSPFVIKKTSDNLLDSNEKLLNNLYLSPESQNSSSSNGKFYTPTPNHIKNEHLSDRFIPMNRGTNLLEKFELTKTWDTKNQNEVIKDADKIQEKLKYNNLLQNNFFGYNNISDDPILNNLGKNSNLDLETYEKSDSSIEGNIKSKIFKFKTETKKKSHFNINLGNIIDNIQNNINTSRKISNKPYKILDAPNLTDDFYLNLLDWSSKNDIAVGLQNSVFLWCGNKTQLVNLFTYEDEKNVSSLIWNQNGTELAVGNADGFVEIWDISYDGHTARVGVVAWHNNNISSGSKDYSIINRDLRMNDKINKYIGHKQEVCGLKWSFDGSHLASGGNDNKLMIWNIHSANPVMKSSNHTAAVKAIAWSPHQHNLLTSGGGTADKCIRFWNTHNYNQINCIDTGSQVCNLVFSKTVNELVSTHGYSLNQIILWKLPNMTKLATLTGHTFRVLYLSLSPDGQNIVTGAGDQSLRFWNIFPNSKYSKQGSSLYFSNGDLR